MSSTRGGTPTLERRVLTEEIMRIRDEIGEPPLNRDSFREVYLNIRSDHVFISAYHYWQKKYRNHKENPDADQS